MPLMGMSEEQGRFWWEWWVVTRLPPPDRNRPDFDFNA